MNEQLKIIISAETGKVKDAVKQAKSQLDGFKGKAKSVATAVKGDFDKIGNDVNAAFTKVGTALAAGGAALLALSASTTEYRQNQAQLNAAFEQAGLSAGSAQGAYKQLYKVIGESDQAVESAANIAMLASSEKEAAQWAELASGVLGTFHDTLQPEAFYEAANETLKLGEATGAFAQMLEQTGVMSVDEFNKKLAECNTEAEKQAFMLEVSNKAMGSAGEAYNKATANIQKQREAQANLQSTLAKVGEAVSPVLTAFTNLANDALAVVTPYIQELSEKYGPKLEEVFGKIGEALQGVADFISAHWETIKTVATIIGAIAIAIGLVSGAITVATTAMTIFNTVMSLSPATIIITAVVAAVLLLIVYFDDLKEIAGKVWNWIKEKISNVAKSIKETVSKLIDKITEFFGNLKQKVGQKIENVKEAVKGKFDSMKTAVDNKVTAIKNSVLEKFKFTGIKDKIQSAIGGAKEKFDSMKSAISTKVSSIVSTVSSKFGSIKGKISEKINGAKDAVKTAIDKIKGFFNFKWSLPKLKMPSINITGKFSLNPPQTPKFSISWNRLGGIFDKPTLFSYGDSIQGLGEDGAEAVVPLEKNTQWLDRLADRLAAKQNGIPIVLQVDGKTFAQVSIDSINALTKQRGTLGLNLL